MDTLFHDSHDSVKGIYSGMTMMPDMIAVNLYGVLDREAIDR